MPISSTSHPAIFINRQRNADYEEKVENALAKIGSTTSGSRLLGALESLAGRGKKVLLNEPLRFRPAPSTSAAFTEAQKRRYGEHESEGRAAFELGLITKGRFTKGEGADATVNWSPDVGLVVNPDGSADGHSPSQAGEAFVGLAHELIHAKHIMAGDFKHGGDILDPNSQSGKEERRATGLGRYSNESVSENRIRQEHGLPIRTVYGD